jgi:hypothetical protein
MLTMSAGSAPNARSTPHVTVGRAALSTVAAGMGNRSASARSRLAGIAPTTRNNPVLRRWLDTDSATTPGPATVGVGGTFRSALPIGVCVKSTNKIVPPASVCVCSVACPPLNAAAPWSDAVTVGAVA